LLALAQDPDLKGEALKVLLYLAARLDFDNWIQVAQTEIAEALGMRKPHVSRAIKLLESKGIVIRGPKVGQSYSWRLNPKYGYKGNPRGKVYRLKDGSLAFQVHDGQEQKPEKSEK
jgi:DNA-binding transcriptional ArsR family regulator